MQKGCGSCKDFDGLNEKYHGLTMNKCAECDKDYCNNKEIQCL